MTQAHVPDEELCSGTGAYGSDHGLPVRWQERVRCPACGRSVALTNSHNVTSHRPQAATRTGGVRVSASASASATMSRDGVPRIDLRVRVRLALANDVAVAVAMASYKGPEAIAGARRRLVELRIFDDGRQDG